MNKLFDVINTFREMQSDVIEYEIINKKQNELNVIFPDAMRKFYHYYGNDNSIMSSFYVFDKIEDIRIENEALTFGKKHQNMGRLGITLKHLSSTLQSISWYDYNMKKWYSEGFVYPESFFLHITCWQLINSMNSVAKVHISECELFGLLGDKLKLFSEEKRYVKGCNMLSLYGNKILGCFLKEDEELYLGSNEGDIVIEEIEENFGLDMDWL